MPATSEPGDRVAGVIQTSQAEQRQLGFALRRAPRRLHISVIYCFCLIYFEGSKYLYNGIIIRYYKILIYIDLICLTLASASFIPTRDQPGIGGGFLLRRPNPEK